MTQHLRPRPAPIDVNPDPKNGLVATWRRRRRLLRSVLLGGSSVPSLSVALGNRAPLEGE